MAQCIIQGLDELIDDMERKWEKAEEVFDEMLEIGAEECKKAWKQSAERHGHKETGEMIAHIDWSKKPIRGSNLKSAHIYPQGKDKRGIRYAAKAFWRHYGTGRKAGTFWVDTADEIAAKEIPPKLWARWNKHLQGD